MQIIIMKRLRVKNTNNFLSFNIWFEKEHDYCLPIRKGSKRCNSDTEDDENFNEINKSLRLDSSSSDKSKTTTNLEKINVNNDLSSCSLYAIDITTELLKDALFENKKKQSNKQSTVISKDFINSSNNRVPAIPNCNQNDINSRLNNESIIQLNNNEKEKSCVSRESTPPKLFSLMDIDSDMIKLFPTLDFSTEHNTNENLENIDKKNIILHGNIEENKNEKVLSFNSQSTETVSISNLPLQKENVVNFNSKIDTVQPKLPNDSQKIASIDSASKINTQLRSGQYLNIFDRYQCNIKKQFVEQVENPGPVLLKDLLCGSKPKTIISPYTHRHLKPYIFRDPVTKPLWLQMLNEIKEHFRRKNGLLKCKEVETIDYSYVRSKYINSVNMLAREFFWPGIDLTESLLYPDFSVIALYKNLVIGFGFMVPDISTNENYITFLFTRPYWTNCGIAKFMIYHLIQTCMTRDITLHVSANNPSMILYQKFGFKIEEFVQNFYENYIPAESELSKHALFLRLHSSLRCK